jgi:hypothetical protein
MVQRFFILSVLLIATVSATTLERLSVDSMVEKSHSIVRGKVISSEGEFRNGLIFTKYLVQVDESWKGNPGRIVEVFVPGGVANGLRQTIPGAPALERGDEFVLFLWAGASGRQQIIGLSQGMFNVVKDEDGAVLLERPGAKEVMMDPQTRRPVRDTTIRMPLGEMKTRVVTKVAEMQEQGANK